MNDLDTEILVQYCEMREEIKDIRRRIGELDKYLEHPPIVSDTVKGTRKDGTYGSIKITGIPDPQYRRKGAARERLRKMLAAKEEELLELTCQAEKYIENIDKSIIRIMFRLYYIDGLTWGKVAERLNQTFVRKKKKFTEEGCKKANQRFMKNL